MQDAHDMHRDLESCQKLIREQASTISEQANKISELHDEMEKIKKLLRHYVNGHRSEKRILTGPEQPLLPFENNEEFQAARAEAQAEAQTIIEAYTVKRHARKRKPRDEWFPAMAT